MQRNLLTERMHRAVHGSWSLCWVSVTLAAALLGVGQADASTSLPRANPADRQVNASALAAAINSARQLSFVKGMVVARDGFVIGEGHWTGTAETLHPSMSVTKSVTSILLGIAIERGLIPDGLDARLVDYLPPEKVPSDPAKREIKLVHLLTMTSGFRWDDDVDLTLWFRHPDPLAFILGRPLVASPGDVWNYNTAASHLLSVVISEASGMSTLEFADTHLFGPLGITERGWQIVGGYHCGGTGLDLSTEGLAKLGVLFANGGTFGGARLLSQYWVNRSTYPSVRNLGSMGPLNQRHYGLLWWVFPGVGSEAYSAWGFGGQVVFCVPTLRLVVATHANHWTSAQDAERQHAAILDIIVNRIVPAATDRRVFTVTGVPVPELASVDEMVQAQMQAYGITSASVAITKDGRLVLAHGYSMDEPGAARTEPTALFEVGSTAMPITSVAIHQLIERGLLRHDTPVAATLGLDPPRGASADPRLQDVTVDHLLTHTAGWDRNEGGIDPMIAKDGVIAASLGTATPPTRDEIATFMAGQPMQFAPGTSAGYCTFGYLLLELLAEQVTGTSFPEFVQENVFRPIGVGRARQGHTLESERFPGEPAYFGVLEGDPYRVTAENYFAAGGQVMAAPDVARLLAVLFDSADAGGLLSRQSIADMLAFPFPVGEVLGMSRGWFHEHLFNLLGRTVGWLTDPDDDARAYGIGGGGPGVQSVAIWHSDGIVFVLLANKDAVIENLDDFPVIQDWPSHDLWESVGITDTRVGSAPTEAWIPVVAHNQGVGTSEWRTDVTLLNRSPLANRARLRAYADDGPHDLDLALAAGEARTLSDVLASLGASGIAPLRVFSSEQLSVTSRTYNQAPTGTFGQSIEAECGTCGLETGDEVVLMQLREDGLGRSNIGILNGWKRAAEVRITLYDGSGAEVVTFDRTIPPERTVQVNRPFRDEGGRSDIDSGYAVVTVRFGRQIVVYGSVVDTGTNDPTTVPMKTLRGERRQWIAAAAHGTGVNDSVWRTDLTLLNLSAATATAQVVLHQPAGTASATVTLAPGQQRVLTDVVAALGKDGSGALEITADAEILAGSRTYNARAEGTFGQCFDGTAASETAQLGETRWLPALHQNAAFRTNIGLVNTGAEEAAVRVRLLSADGRELASPLQILRPGERVQLQEPFLTVAGRADVASGTARVDVEAGGGVIAYASVVDNVTNDPTTVGAQR